MPAQSIVAGVECGALRISFAVADSDSKHITPNLAKGFMGCPVVQALRGL
jgi:hypothetical protein